jgi:TPP-dependent pyruvate/acetoin dehydrogenase alpha subunit
MRDLLLKKKAKESEIATLEAECKKEIEEAVEYANSLPPPDDEEALKNVFFGE